MDQMIKCEGLAWCPTARDHVRPVTYYARTHREAGSWVWCNRDWIKGAWVVGPVSREEAEANATGSAF
jgi:hypothetical protein